MPLKFLPVLCSIQCDMLGQVWWGWQQVNIYEFVDLETKQYELILEIKPKKIPIIIIAMFLFLLWKKG